VSTEERFDELVALFDGPLAIITTAAKGERAGCLIGFQSQSSIGPRRLALWLSKANHTFRVGMFATHFAVHFPEPATYDLAELFGGLSGDDVDKFARCRWEPGPGGLPLLVRCPHRVLVRKVALLDEGGDHVCVTTEVLEVHGDAAFTPLRLSGATGITPGHEAGERPVPEDLRS
jgi:flavin reductase (DIM6/NTAB) family NADH-FMN oxidoreductase RutF